MKAKKAKSIGRLKTYYITYRVVGMSAVRMENFPTAKKRADFIKWLDNDSSQYEIIKQWDV